MAGQNGVDGRHVRKPVDLVLSNVLEAARDRLLVMAGNPALDLKLKDKRAKRNPAQVRKNTFGIITEVFPISHSFTF